MNGHINTAAHKTLNHCSKAGGVYILRPTFSVTKETEDCLFEA